MLITQTTEFRSVFSPRTIAGIAMVTIVVSSRIMKNPTHKAASAAHGLTCLAISCSPAAVHNRQTRRDVRPENPPGFKILDQPLRPVQFGLTLVMHVRLVDPVHDGHLLLPHVIE